MRKLRIRGSRTAVWRFFARHDFTFKKKASSCSRVGDFSLINLISCFLLLLSLWACGQRSCVVHMSTAMLRFALLSLRAGGALRTFGRRNQGKFGMLSYL
jgi:hypothetical protein